MQTDPTRDTAAAAAPVLVVDLDGTLCRTDTLHESLLSIAAHGPRALAGLLGPLKSGRAAFKAKVADERIMQADGLPINEDVVALIRDARAKGARTALVSAADERQVRAVGEALDLFDEVHGSTSDRNLKGSAKAAFLVERFGERGFDYVGDSPADVAVWRHAREAITVSASDRVRRRAEGAAEEATHIDGPETGAAFLKAIRPHQWVKNLLIFLPVIAAHDLSRIGPALLAFVAFCLMASSAYLVNDLLDLEADRAHPRKRLRPFAAGTLSLSTGVFAAAGMIFAALAIAATTGQIAFVGLLVLYLVATLAYSFWLKRKPIIDVIMLGGLYTVRIVAGAAAVSIALTPWMLAFSLFLFLSLAAVKRQAEIMDSVKDGREVRGRGYMEEDLPLLRGIALSAGNAAVVVFALYINSPEVTELYGQPLLLWAVCPALLYWLYRMTLKAHRHEMDDDPIVFAVRDRLSIAVIGFSALCVLGAAVL